MKTSLLYICCPSNLLQDTSFLNLMADHTIWFLKIWIKLYLRLCPLHTLSINIIYLDALLIFYAQRFQNKNKTAFIITFTYVSA